MSASTRRQRAVTVADVRRVLDGLYPPGLAESWDVNGLYCGDPGATVTGILLAVDPTDDVIAQSAEMGCELLLTHHPLLLRGIHSVTSDHPKGRRLQAMLRAGINGLNVHTPADSAPDGVTDAIARLIGLGDVTPLDPHDDAPSDKLVAFVPPSHVPPLVDALDAAGAGRIGDYSRCHFTVDGQGHFTAGADTRPFVGSAGGAETVAECRLEIVLPRRRRTAVVEALLATHPYETPAFDLIELASVDVRTGIGRVGALAEPLPARELAALLARRLPATVTGIKLGGDPDRSVSRVAILAGSGDSHLDKARRAGVDAYVTSDLRHHPAEEALAWADAPVLIDVPHWACEWAWLPTAARALKADPRMVGVDVHVSELRTEPWAVRF